MCDGETMRKTHSWELALAAYRKMHKAMQTPISRQQHISTGSKMDAAISWLTEHCKPDQGHTQQTTIDDAEHLQGMTRAKLYGEMAAELKARPGADEHKLCCYSYFTKAITRMNTLAKEGVSGMVEVMFDPWCTQGECAVCTALKVLRRRAMAAGDVEEKKWCDKLLESHNLVARLERLCYHIRIERAVIRHKTWSFAVDGYCVRKSAVMRSQGHNISDMKGCPGLADAETVKYKTTGVLAHGFGYFLYVADPVLPANANLNVEVLYQTLQYMLEVLADPNDDRITVPPDELFIQVDGASDNRALVVFMFCELLIRMGMFDTIKMSFLIVGHTHNDIDQKFAPITKALRAETIKSVDDLIKAYWAAYPHDPPLAIKRIAAVGDYTQWLVAECGLPFAGCSRRTPDENRPHQYLFTADGEGGNRCDYKNLAIDDTVWNTDSIKLLKCMPNPQGPPMQKPKLDHITKLASTRAGVLANFRLNERIDGFFTPTDRLKMEELFDQFCDVDERGNIEPQINRLTSIMAKQYKFVMLQPPAVVVPNERTVKGHVREPVEPITHAKFTPADRQRALAEVRKEAEEQAEADDRLVESQGGKALERGAKHLSKKAVAALAKYQEKMMLDVHKRPTNALPVFESNVCGAALDGTGQLKFLVDVGDTVPDLKWALPNQADLDTLDDRILTEEVVIWWNDGTATGRSTPFDAVVQAFDDEMSQHQVHYTADDTVELIDFRTLRVQALDATRLDDLAVRVMWILKNCKGRSMLQLPCFALCHDSCFACRCCTTASYSS